jgi:hypothetical protein
LRIQCGGVALVNIFFWEGVKMKSGKQSIKSVKTAVIIGTIVLAVLYFFPEISSREILSLSVISIIAVVFSPIAGLIICFIDWIFLTIYQAFQENYFFSLGNIFIDFLCAILFKFLYGLTIGLWGKWYKIKEKEITTKTLLVFNVVQFVALTFFNTISLIIWITLIDGPPLKEIINMRFLASALLLSIFVGVLTTLFICVLFRKQLVIDFSINGIKNAIKDTSIPIKKSTLKIIGKVGILLVVLGFFMPVSCDLNGFEMANYILKMDSSNAVGIALYLLFISSLISGLLIIPLLMNKKLHIGIDWSCLILSIGCGIYAYSKLEDSIAMYGALSGQKLQSGGWFILIGWIVAFVALGIASLKKEKTLPPIENNQLNT